MDHALSGLQQLSCAGGVPCSGSDLQQKHKLLCHWCPEPAGWKLAGTDYAATVVNAKRNSSKYCAVIGSQSNAVDI